MAQALRTPTITPDFVGGNAFLNPSTPVSNISSNLMPNGRLKGSLTDGMQKFADGIDAIYRVQAQATAKEMDNRFSQAAQNTLFDPDNGYYNKKGKAAVDGYKSAVETLKADFQQGKNGVDDPFIQRMYDQSTGARLQTMLNQAQQHYAEGVFSWNVSESKARIANLGNTAITAVNSWNDDKGVYMQYRKAIEGEVNDMAEMYGMDKNSEQYTNLMTESMTTFHSGALDMFLAKDSVGSASGYLKKFKSEMDADTVAKYENKIHDLADRLEAKRERLAAKQAAAQVKPEYLIGLERVKYYQKRQELESQKEKMTRDEYFQKRNELTSNFLKVVKDINDAANFDKANKVGEAIRINDSLVADRLEQFDEDIKKGKVTDLSDMFSGVELQLLDENGLTDSVKARAFGKDPNYSSKALEAFKAVPDPFSNSGRDECNQWLLKMSPEDQRRAQTYLDKKRQGKGTPFEDALKGYAQELAEIKDGKMPKSGTAQHILFTNISAELKNRTADLVRDIPKPQLTVQKVLDCLAVAMLQQKQKYTKKGVLFNTEEDVPRNSFTGLLEDMPEAYIDYVDSKNNSIKVSAKTYSDYVRDVVKDLLRNPDHLATGQAFEDEVMNRLRDIDLNLQNQNTAMTNAIIDK